MIHGVVNLRREATLPVVIGNSSGEREVIDTVIDTGFNGFLSLPSEIIMLIYELAIASLAVGISLHRLKYRDTVESRSSI
jgi:predicted aspartyl protease